MVYSKGKKFTKISSNSKSSEQIYLGSRKKTVAPPDETRRAEVRRIDITFPRTRPIAKRLVGPSQQMTRSTEPEATADPPIIDGWNTSAYSKGPGKASQHHGWPTRDMTRESGWKTNDSSNGSGCEIKCNRHRIPRDLPGDRTWLRPR